MKIPKTFLPEKSLSNKVRSFLTSFDRIACLINDKVSPYFLVESHCPDNKLKRSSYVSSAIEYSTFVYRNYLENAGYKEVRIKAFKLKKSAVPCKEELLNESENIPARKWGDTDPMKNESVIMIKQEYALIIYGEKEDINFFKNYYQKEFGFY